jgi:YHS domain-containing protein
MNNLSFKPFSFSLTLLAFALLMMAFQKQTLPEVYVANGKAINGYDAVAFFTEQKPTTGNEAFSYKWNGATWIFASQQNLEAFAKNPAKYAPQYGGYRAFGTADGHKAPTQADTWTVQDDKLYFNYNSAVKKQWDKDRMALIKKADTNWPTIKLQ